MSLNLQFSKIILIILFLQTISSSSFKFNFSLKSFSNNNLLQSDKVFSVTSSSIINSSSESSSSLKFKLSFVIFGFWLTSYFSFIPSISITPFGKFSNCSIPFLIKSFSIPFWVDSYVTIIITFIKEGMLTGFNSIISL